jgi:tellurium resistance protein TerD
MINLKKGQKIDLTKETTLKALKVGLGWDINKYDGGNDFDLDGIVTMTKDDECGDDDDMIYFNNIKDRNGSVVHSGDNLTGEGDGDDETITVSLDKVPADIEKLNFHIVIYEADSRGQNFGQVGNAYARVLNEENGEELCRYDLSEDHSTATRMLLATLYRHNGEWKFQAVGQGQSGGLNEITQEVGLK